MKNVNKVLVLSVVFVTTLALAQAPELNPDRPQHTAVPTVTFTYAMEGAVPAHYSIAVDSTGKAAYRSEDADQRSATPGEPFIQKFVVSPATAARIFDLAKQADFFQGNVEFKGKVANMGAKTLTFSDTDNYHQAAYNFSTNSAIQQLTELFQGLSETLEYGKKLTFLHRFDRLGLDAELKSMEQEAAHNRLPELEADQAILQTIANDTAVMNMTRRRAQNLLGKIQASTAAEKPTSESK